MKQIRFITHNDNHVDEETLIDGIWAVTRCDCKLTNAALLPDSKEIDMYDGWTEPQSFTDARTMRRALNEGARNLYPRQTTEADADALHDCIFAAELADEQKQQAAEAAEILEWLPIPEPAQLVHQWDERNPLVDDAEGCGYDADMPNYARGG